MPSTHKLACFNCRISRKAGSAIACSTKCERCGSEMQDMGPKWRMPRKSAVSKWKKFPQVVDTRYSQQPWERERRRKPWRKYKGMAMKQIWKANKAAFTKGPR